MEELTLKIQGEFICNLARSWFWEEDRAYETCEELLLACLVTDELSEEEKKRIVVDILEGRKILVGVNELELVEDGEQIRSLSEKFKEYERKEMLRKIEEDMKHRPLAYVDPYACNKDINTYEPVDNLVYEDRHLILDAFGSRLTPCEQVRLWIYSYGNSWGDFSRLSPGSWDEESRPFLDNGLYLIERPELVYELIGGPVTGFNRDELFRKLGDYLASLVEEKIVTGSDATEILHRNLKQKASTKEIPETESISNSDDLNEITTPDQFLSEYGLIDPSGNYYSCYFAGHHRKAYNILKARGVIGYNFEKALDKLYSDGWALIRNPDPGGSVFFDYRADRRPTKHQIDTAFDHMIKFNERTLPGIKEYLED